jgi:hypothetical protein
VIPNIFQQFVSKTLPNPTAEAKLKIAGSVEPFKKQLLCV